eukprot:353108-Chlamydomonas_euryale.AAC.2
MLLCMPCPGREHCMVCHACTARPRGTQHGTPYDVTHRPLHATLHDTLHLTLHDTHTLPAELDARDNACKPHGAPCCTERNDTSKPILPNQTSWHIHATPGASLRGCHAVLLRLLLGQTWKAAPSLPAPRLDRRFRRASPGHLACSRPWAAPLEVARHLRASRGCCGVAVVTCRALRGQAVNPPGCGVLPPPGCELHGRRRA